MKLSKIVLTIIIVSGMVGLGLILLGCTETVSYQRALAEAKLAEAAKLQAGAQGEVNIVTANTDAYTRRLETELKVYQERERFDHDLAWQTYTDHLLEIQQFTQTMENAEAIVESSQAAADNSYWSFIAIIGLGVVILCIGGLGAYLYKQANDRLTKIEALLKGENGETTAV